MFFRNFRIFENFRFLRILDFWEFHFFENFRFLRILDFSFFFRKFFIFLSAAVLRVR